MPRFSYQCVCGLQFEARAKPREHSDPKPCPSCSEDAPRMMPETVAGHFNQAPDSPAPQNTGVHDFDTHVDRVVGASAEAGWEVAQARHKAKREFLERNPDVEGKDLSRNEDGSYGVLSKDERGVSERANDINSAAMTKLHQARAANRN